MTNTQAAAVYAAVAGSVAGTALLGWLAHLAARAVDRFATKRIQREVAAALGRKERS